MDGDVRQKLDDLARLGERHGRTLYGNGQVGLTTRVHQVEQSVSTLAKILDEHRSDRRALYAAIAANAVTILAAIAAAAVGLLR